MKLNKLKRLDKIMALTLRVFNDTIDTLEKTNKEYEVLKGTITTEIGVLVDASNLIDEKTKVNDKLLLNFKKLLS